MTATRVPWMAWHMVRGEAHEVRTGGALALRRWFWTLAGAVTWRALGGH